MLYRIIKKAREKKKGFLFIHLWGDNMKKKKSKNRLEYEKEIRNLKKRIRRAEKNGAIFNTQIIPEMPKRVTKKMISNIKSIRGSKLYEKGIYVSSFTGEAFEGVNAYKAKKEDERKRRQFYREGYIPSGERISFYATMQEMGFLNELINDLHSIPTLFQKNPFAREQAYESSSTILNILNQLIKDLGIDAIGKQLYSLKPEITEEMAVLMYDSSVELIRTAGERLISIIKPDISLSDRLDIADEMEGYEEGFEQM